jgi:hypothetical protein
MSASPSIFSAELGRMIGIRMSAGEPLVSICRDADMPSLDIAMNWLNNPSDPRFGVIVRDAFDNRLADRLRQFASLSPDQAAVRRP